MQSYATLIRRFIYLTQDQDLTETVRNEVSRTLIFELQVKGKQGDIPIIGELAIHNKLGKTVVEYVKYGCPFLKGRSLASMGFV